jgi:hypothetical protein
MWKCKHRIRASIAGLLCSSVIFLDFAFLENCFLMAVAYDHYMTIWHHLSCTVIMNLYLCDLRTPFPWWVHYSWVSWCCGCPSAQTWKASTSVKFLKSSSTATLIPSSMTSWHTWYLSYLMAFLSLESFSLILKFSPLLWEHHQSKEGIPPPLLVDFTYQLCLCFMGQDCGVFIISAAVDSSRRLQWLQWCTLWFFICLTYLSTAWGIGTLREPWANSSMP